MNLIDAVIKGDVAQMKTLLEQGADPNMCLDAAKLRPLHFAAQNNAVEIAELLITAGADIHARTIPDGETPLDIARLHNNQEIVALLS